MNTTVEEQLSIVLKAAGFNPALGPALLRGDRGLPENPGLALVAVDPPAIQQLVLASRRAVSRKGASDRLARWDDDLRAWQGDLSTLGPAAPLYAGGGQAVLLSTAQHALAVAEGLRTRFQERLFGRLGAAVLEVSPRMLVEGPEQPDGVSSSLGRLGLRSPTRGFGALLSPLMARLRADKDAAVPTQPVAGRRCAECGTRSASERGPDGTTWVCEACAIFRQNGGREDLVTFADLGEGRVLAYLYVDGTGIGSKLAGLGSLAEYERFSSALLRAFDYEGVVLPAMERAGHRSRDEVVPVLRGGDDLLLVLGATSGRGAFAATVELVAGIERALDDGGYDDVGVGVGLVVSAHLQARQGFDLAKKLLQSAKVRARRSGARSGIDFEVVQGGAVLGESLEAIREDRERPVEKPAPWPAGRKLRLHRRPLLLDEARALLETSEHLEEDQRSVLYRLEEELRRDMLAGLSAATYALARQDATLAQGLTGHARPPVPGPTVDLGLLCAPFDEGKVKGWSTAIPDLLDLHRITRGSRP